MREVRRQHDGELLALTMDQGGSGFDQIYLLDPACGEARRSPTAEALNNRLVWEPQRPAPGLSLHAPQWRSNDIWLMDIDAPGAGPAGAGRARRRRCGNRSASAATGACCWCSSTSDITDSRIHLLDLDSGELRELVGLPDQDSSNVAIGFDARETGVFFVSNKRGRAAEIGWAPLDPARSQALCTRDHQLGHHRASS